MTLRSKFEFVEQVREFQVPAEDGLATDEYVDTGITAPEVSRQDPLLFRRMC